MPGGFLWRLGDIREYFESPGPLGVRENVHIDQVVEVRILKLVYAVKREADVVLENLLIVKSPIEYVVLRVHELAAASVRTEAGLMKL